jgi:hypothetical protein
MPRFRTVKRPVKRWSLISGIEIAERSQNWNCITISSKSCRQIKVYRTFCTQNYCNRIQSTKQGPACVKCVFSQDFLHSGRLLGVMLQNGSMLEMKTWNLFYPCKAVVCVIGVLELGQFLRFTTLNAMETKHEYFIITVSEYYCNIDKNEKLHVTNSQKWWYVHHSLNLPAEA